MTAYQGNRESANDLAIESSPVGQPLLELLDHNGSWDGSAGELLEALEKRVSDQMKRHKGWPKNGRSLVGHLKRLSPNLRLTGWEVEYHREASRRSWSIHRHDGASSALTQPIRGHDATEEQNGAESCDFNLRDADDANDANLQLQMAGWEQNGVGYEEGEL
ncbi:MAG: hypothetical protein IH898_04090 [Planctomycetes bacterium]|nr:hypothetical protein [Planctomycetota bacterium]